MLKNPKGDKKSSARGEKGGHVWARLVQKVDERKTSCELSGKVI